MLRKTLRFFRNCPTRYSPVPGLLVAYLAALSQSSQDQDDNADEFRRSARSTSHHMSSLQNSLRSWKWGTSLSDICKPIHVDQKIPAESPEALSSDQIYCHRLFFLKFRNCSSRYTFPTYYLSACCMTYMKSTCVTLGISYMISFPLNLKCFPYLCKIAIGTSDTAQIAACVPKLAS